MCGTGEPMLCISGSVEKCAGPRKIPGHHGKGGTHYIGDYNDRSKRVDKNAQEQHHRVHCAALHIFYGQLQNLAGMVSLLITKK